MSSLEAQKARARRLQERIDALTNGEQQSATRPESPREATDRAAAESRKEQSGNDA